MQTAAPSSITWRCADANKLPADTGIPGLQSYEAWIGAHSTDYHWPEFDENSASSMCYTSGTTGNPKGVLYSHRSTLLHAFAGALPDALNISARLHLASGPHVPRQRLGLAVLCRPWPGASWCSWPRDGR